MNSQSAQRPTGCDDVWRHMLRHQLSSPRHWRHIALTTGCRLRRSWPALDKTRKLSLEVAPDNFTSTFSRPWIFGYPLFIYRVQFRPVSHRGRPSQTELRRHWFSWISLSILAEKRTFFSGCPELSPMILTYENNLDVQVKSQNEPPRQISRSNIISLESYHPDTQTDNHRGPTALPGH